MLSKNIYKRNKALKPDNKKRKVVLSVILAIALISIGFGVYRIGSLHQASDKKEVIKIKTGDQPLNQSTTIFVNADGGLSLRKEQSATSQRLTLIPNNTKLTTTSSLNGWYQVTYNGQTGWIAEKYTTTQAPLADPTSTWSVFTGSNYKIKYPIGWKYQNYGANQANNASSLVAFSDQDLPTTVPTGSQFIAPVIVQVSNQTLAAANSTYSTISGVVTTNLTIAGVAANEYTYTSASSETQVTAIVFSAGGSTFIMNESGGYSDDLLKMANTFSL
jgi:hypothetical protein